MSDRADLLQRVHEAVGELIHPRRSVERYEMWDHNRNRVRKTHAANHPSLLDALAEAVEPGGTHAEDGGHSVPGSRPSARLDAVDRLLAIEAGTAMACRLFSEPLKATTADNLRTLSAAAGRVDAEGLRSLAADLRRWVTWAEVATGWHTPAWRPDACCPCCERRGGLRVRLDPGVGCCLECGADWPRDEIDILAAHIRKEAESRKRPAPTTPDRGPVFYTEEQRKAYDKHPPTCMACGEPVETAWSRVSGDRDMGRWIILAQSCGWCSDTPVSSTVAGA